MKIAYIIESLVPFGGTEKILTEKANYLSSQWGYDIYFIACTQSAKEPNAYPLLNNVTQYNLDIPYYKQYRYRYPKRLWIKLKTDKLLKTELTRRLQEIKPDIIIGTAGFKGDIISTLNCNAKKIIECHEARYFIMADLDKRRSFFSHIYVDFLKKRKYFRTIEKNADVVVTLTDGDKKLWKNAKRVEVIPNFSTMEVFHLSKCENKRVIAVGRLSPEKGYDRLLKIWALISSDHPDWHLDIFGEGKLYNELISDIKEYNIKNIYIHNPTPNINQEYATSSICVMTSYLEGFGLSILEAFKHGVPCIAFDCPFGPASIIKDGICGYLIDDNNIQLYADKLSMLMHNNKTLKILSSAATERAKDFSVDSVMEYWKKLFENL